MLAGDARAIARAISLIEDESPGAADLVGAIFARTGRAYLVGVTGPPGAGKSTLVDRLIAELRKASRTVGVIAVDPTSPFTGGAVLGDRLRMQAHASDEGVFIRSMATRGHLGGLARATGDEVQALKAGIMEIADIFVVNKADREGADRLVSAVEANLALQTYGEGEWRPPILKTVATSGRGVAELVEAIWRFRERSVSTQADRRRIRSEHRLRELVSQRFMDHLERDVLASGELRALVDRIAARQVDPYSAASDLLHRALADSKRV